MSYYKKGDLYRFSKSLINTKSAPTNVFSLVSHFVDEEDKKLKLVLRDSGTLDVLLAVADDMEKVDATFEDKILSCLTDLGESLRVIAQNTALSIEFEEEEEPQVQEEEAKPNKKKNIH